MKNRVSRTIRLPNGEEAELSSDDLSYGDLILAEVLLEFCAARGTTEITEDDIDEVMDRIRAKGYNPITYEPIC
jgi:hypothetical protein